MYVVKMVRFLCIIIISKSGILDTKICLKFGNPIEVFFIIAVVVRDAFLYNEIVVLRPKCRTKSSDYAGKPYSIGISANG